MPELSRFYGITIIMQFFDIKQYNKPHVHVQYVKNEAVVGIDGELLVRCVAQKYLANSLIK